LNIRIFTSEKNVIVFVSRGIVDRAFKSRGGVFMFSKELNELAKKEKRNEQKE